MGCKFCKGFEGFPYVTVLFSVVIGRGKKKSYCCIIGSFYLNRVWDEHFAPGNLTFHGTGEHSRCVAPYEKWESVLVHLPAPLTAKLDTRSDMHMSVVHI